MKMIKAVMVAVLMGFAAMAQAGFYAGVGAGVADVDLDAAQASALGPDFGTDSSDTGYKAFAGVTFGPVGIEASYANLGEYGFSTPSASIGGEIEGVGLAVVGIIPLVDDLSLTLKAGAFDWETTSTGTIAVAEGSGTDAFYGVGLESKVARHFMVRGEYERFNEIEVDMVSVNLGLTF